MKTLATPFLEAAWSAEPAAAQAPQRATILAVDDAPTNLKLLSSLLAGDYRVQVAPSGAKALELVQRKLPDLILLDVMMPGLDGYEVCRRLKADLRTRDVPVVFLTALNEAEDETRGFEAGGADFITKPITPATLHARVRTQLAVKSWHDAMRDRNGWLQQALDDRLEEVNQLRDTTLQMMVSLAEFRDTDTGNHLKRTQEYVRVLATWLARNGPADTALNEEQIEALAKAAPLHDIGKVAIPDRILLKPGPLTAEEWVVMRTHTVQGAVLLERAINHLGDRAGMLLRFGQEIAHRHHEKWDGSGYPDGLAGPAIPLSARLMAVADVYDALISRRPYKEPMSHAEAMLRIERDSGTHFDPDIVAALCAVQDQFIEIAKQWHD